MLRIGRLHSCQTISEIRHHRVSAMYVQGDDVGGRQKMEVFLLQMGMDRNGDPPPQKAKQNWHAYDLVWVCFNRNKWSRF